MLRNFRSVIKSDPKIVGAVMLVLTIAMVISLGGGLKEEGSQTLARVYGRRITRQDVGNVVNARQQAGSQEPLTHDYYSKILDQLIEGKLHEEMAERYGVVVPDLAVREAQESELRREIIGRPDLVAQLFGSDNHLKPLPELEKLPVFARMKGGAAGYFKSQELAIRGQLRRTQMLRNIALSMPIDAAWVEGEHRYRQEKLDLEIVTVQADGKDLADPGDPALQAFLQQSGSRFQEGPRRQVQVALAESAALQAPLDEATLKQLYAQKKAQFTTPGQVRARHILFMANTPDAVVKALKRAQELRPKLLAGLDFAKTAEAQSEDPSAKQAGAGFQGDLGFFTRERMVKEFSDAAFAMKVGEISQPVKTQYGIHLIKVEGIKPETVTPFEAVKDALQKEEQQARALGKAKERLAELKKRAGNGDLANGAKALGMKVVEPTPFSREATALDGLEGSQGLVAEAFDMELGTNREPKGQVGGGFALLRVQKELPIAVPPLKEIRPKVLAAWRRAEARKTLLVKAQAAVQAGDLKTLGQPRTESGKAPNQISGAADPLVRKALLETPAGQFTAPLFLPTPDGQGVELWVARIVSRTAAPALEFEARKQLAEGLQYGAAQRRYFAEVSALLDQGRKKSDYSSLWGQFGVHKDEKALKALTGPKEK